eukprot:s301_g17.t1
MPGTLNTFTQKHAALWAGADFHQLHTSLYEHPPGYVPHLKVVSLRYEPEEWQKVKPFFPADKGCWPTDYIDLGHLFVCLDSYDDGPDRLTLPGGTMQANVSSCMVQKALSKGWNLAFAQVQLEFCHNNGKGFCRGGSPLDLAILCGHAECADALASPKHI